MNLFTKTLITGLSAITLLGCSGADDDSNAQIPLSSIRILHASPDAPPVDISLEGSTAFAGVDYGESSRRISVFAGGNEVQVDGILPLPAGGTTTVIGPVDLTFDAASTYEVLAVGSVDTIDAIVHERPLDFDASQVRITVLHAAESAPPVDVYLTAPDADLAAATPLDTIAFEGVIGPALIDEGAYRVRITAQGSADVIYDSGLLDYDNREDMDGLRAGQDFFIAAIENPLNTGNTKSPVVLAVGLDGAAMEIVHSVDDGADVRIVHNSAGAGPVDVIADNDDLADPVTLADSLAFPQFTQYLNVPADSYDVSIFAEDPAPEDMPLVNVEALALASGGVYTAIALNVGEDIEALVLTDDTRSVATEAKVRIVHGSTLAGTVDIYVTEVGADITDLDPTITGFEFKDDTGYLSLAEGSYGVTVTPENEKTAAIEAELSLSAGQVVDAIARDNADLDGVGLLLIVGDDL